MQDLRKSADIWVEKSKEKYREEVLGRSHKTGKFMSVQIPSYREESRGNSLIVREVEMDIKSDWMDTCWVLHEAPPHHTRSSHLPSETSTQPLYFGSCSTLCDRAL